eukprot:15037968-Alexandrium_andersonii.AAC.1
MSASLVGSEMCIRDSRAPKASSPSAGGTALRAFRTAPRRMRFGPLRAPVSYTHLTLPMICSV